MQASNWIEIYCKCCFHDHKRLYVNLFKSSWEFLPCWSSFDGKHFEFFLAFLIKFSKIQSKFPNILSQKHEILHIQTSALIQLTLGVHAIHIKILDNHSSYISFVCFHDIDDHCIIKSLDETQSWVHRIKLWYYRHAMAQLVCQNEFAPDNLSRCEQDEHTEIKQMLNEVQVDWN